MKCHDSVRSSSHSMSWGECSALLLLRQQPVLPCMCLCFVAVVRGAVHQHIKAEAEWQRWPCLASWLPDGVVGPRQLSILTMGNMDLAYRQTFDATADATYGWPMAGCLCNVTLY